MLRPTMCPSSGETTVFFNTWYFYSLWISVCYADSHPHIRPKHVEIDKCTKNKLCIKLVLFTRLYRDAHSTKHKIHQCSIIILSATITDAV